MYGLVTALSAELGEESLPFGISKTNGRFALFGTTTAMASASAYFLYILGTKLSGSSCLYCLVSAFLSFSLFFLSLKVSIYFHFFTFLDLLYFDFDITSKLWIMFMCSLHVVGCEVARNTASCRIADMLSDHSSCLLDCFLQYCSANPCTVI